MEKAFKELILALRSIGDALMGKINSSNNNNEGGFLRNYNTVVGVKGIGYVANEHGIQYIIEETPIFLFDKTKSLDENFKLFYSQNIEFATNYEQPATGQTFYELLAVYENNDNKNIYDFNCFYIYPGDITDEYDYDNLLEFLSNENCVMSIRCENRRIFNIPNLDFVPVDNKHYIIFSNDYLTLHSNNDNPGGDFPGPGSTRSVKKSSSESEESFKSFINRLKENRERFEKEREERNAERRKAFLEFLNKLKKTEEEKETTEKVKEEVKEEIKEPEKSSELETKQEETR